MKQLYPLVFVLCLLTTAVYGQEDTIIRQKDSLEQDSIKPKPVAARVSKPMPVADTSFQTDSLKIQDSLRIADSIMAARHIADSIQRKLSETKPEEILKEGTKKNFVGKEWLFYYLVLLLIFFGLLRRAFGKYFYDLFRVFFRTTLKQRQTQDQLLQSPLPSVFMNVFFVLSAGLYLNFLLGYFGFSVVSNFWLQYFYCIVALASIYIVKFIGLKLTGWLFNVSNATDSYVFIVFIVNKMMGIYFLPFLLLLAFAPGPLYNAAMILSWFGIGLLLIYRFILSYGAVRKEVKLNSFHFILYVLGFEVIPLLLIYKLLLLIF